MAPTAVRMVLVEGENGDGALVDEEKFDVGAEPPTASTESAEQVISAILGTREGAAQGGYQLASTGVTWQDPSQAAALRDALATRKVENVMLVSAFLAAAALAHSVGNETNYAQTALLFIEPDAATLAVVDSADGSIADIHRQPLAADDDAAVAQLASLVSAAEELATRPDAVFVVGSGVDVPMIKPALEAATTLPVTAPEEPETALARGAALASANTPLLSSSTAAQAWAQDPGTGAVTPLAFDPVHFESAESGLAYSAVDSADSADVADEQEDRKPFALLGSILLSIFVIGVASLVVSLAVSIRHTSGTRPEPGQAIVVPTEQVPQAPAPAPQAPAPVPEQAPAPIPEQAPVPEQPPVQVPQAPVNAPQAPVEVPQAPAPVPVPQAPAPVPAAPAPVPVPVPVPLPPIFTPQLPSLDPPGRGGGGKPPNIGKPSGPKGPGGGPGKGGKGGRGGGGGRGGFNIPGIPGI
ncbi:hypothetical protein A9X01_00540 [Mycobacterium asiaticum]|uniref:DUF7159 domain-containing protein n=2 Tax=Mycobacterium asiaticum TaxID=1790 RepID=A0A1A3D1Z8_MYCAS|nr:hypothetical protein A9X01_00540 [Mycobacterium asiaticum]